MNTLPGRASVGRSGCRKPDVDHGRLWVESSRWAADAGRRSLDGPRGDDRGTEMPAGMESFALPSEVPANVQ
jgi:hypothetical protein